MMSNSIKAKNKKHEHQLHNIRYIVSGPYHSNSICQGAACFSTRVKKYPRCSMSSFELPRSTTWPSLRHMISSSVAVMRCGSHKDNTRTSFGLPRRAQSIFDLETLFMIFMQPTDPTVPADTFLIFLDSVWGQQFVSQPLSIKKWIRLEQLCASPTCTAFSVWTSICLAHCGKSMCNDLTQEATHSETMQRQGQHWCYWILSVYPNYGSLHILWKILQARNVVIKIRAKIVVKPLTSDTAASKWSRTPQAQVYRIIKIHVF